MASVDQIKKRLATETAYYDRYKSGSLDTQYFPEIEIKEEPVPLKPVRKVSAAGLAGAFSVLVVFILGQFGIDLTPEVASALTTVFAFGVAYMVPASTEDEQTVTN